MLYSDLSEYNTGKLYFALGENGENAITFCESHGLVPVEKVCLSCGANMNKVNVANKKTGLMWRCSRPCRKEESFLKGTFFEGTHCKIDLLIKFIYCWAFEECSVKKIQRDLGFAEHTIVDWRSFVREICALKIMATPVLLGGEGREVQIDESLFARRKYNRGRLVRQQWVFGAIDCISKESIVIPVDKRDESTLLPLIKKYILPGSVIVSDGWSAYLNLNMHGYQHYVVNHSENFVDPLTGFHTNRVENMWMRAKRRNKMECGTKKEMVDEYMFEFMWRCKYGDEPFKNIIEHIKLFY